MSMRDKTMIFSEDQTLIINHSTATISTNVIDLTGGYQDLDGFGNSIDANIGENGMLKVVMVLSTGYTGNAAGLYASFYSHTAAGVESGTMHWRVLIPTGAAKGTTYVMLVPIADLKRYAGLSYYANTGNGTAGAISAWIDVTHQSPV